MKRFSLNNTISDFASNVRDYKLVAVVSLVWFLVQFLRYLFPALFPTFQSAFDISSTQTGLLFTLLMIGYSVTQFPSGWLADRFTEPIVITMGIIIFTSATIFIILTPNYALLVVAAVFIGIGTGAHKTPAIPYLSRSYPHRTGFVLGVMDTIGQLGGTTAPIVVVAIIGLGYSWRIVFAVSAVLSMIVGIIFTFQVFNLHLRETKSLVAHTENNVVESGAKEEGNPSYRSIFLQRRVLIFVGVAMAFTFTWNGFSAFFPLFIANTKGINSGIGGLLYSLLFIMSITQTVTGSASDRYQRINICIILFVIMAICMLGLLTFDTVFVVVIATAFLGIGFHGFRPVRDSYFVELFPSKAGSGLLGVVRTGMTFVGAISPTVVGYISDVANLSMAFSILIIPLIFSILSLLTLRFRGQ